MTVSVNSDFRWNFNTRLVAAALGCEPKLSVSERSNRDHRILGRPVTISVGSHLSEPGVHHGFESHPKSDFVDFAL